jgi:hypothetical protein
MTPPKFREVELFVQDLIGSDSQSDSETIVQTLPQSV